MFFLLGKGETDIDDVGETDIDDVAAQENDQNVSKKKESSAAFVTDIDKAEENTGMNRVSRFLVCLMILKHNSGMGMIDDKVKDYFVMNGVSYFFSPFYDFLCEIA